jgi:spartin
MHPAYKNSRIVSKAAAASRLIVTTSGYVGQALQSQADGFTQRTKPTSKPLTFNPTTHAHIRRIHTFSEGAAGLSAKTVAQVQKYAQNLGAAMARRSESERAVKGIGPDGQPVENYKPGLLNKSMMAFSTVADGIDQAARNLLASTSTAATTVVGHRFGPEAGEISRNLSGGFKNVALVYIDASGVSRRAIVKSVAKGVVVGRVRGGGDLVVGGGGGGGVGGVDGGVDGGGDGGQVFAAPPQHWKEKEAAEGRYTDDPYMHGGRESLEMVGFGRATSAYGMERRESLEGQKVPGKW